MLKTGIPRFTESQCFSDVIFEKGYLNVSMYSVWVPQLLQRLCRCMAQISFHSDYQGLRWCSTGWSGLGCGDATGRMPLALAVFVPG